MELPSVSIVLPIRNEAGFIGRVLDAVLAQDYPAEKLEVVVADGMSSDGTREVVRTAIERLEQSGAAGPRLVLIENPGRTMPLGANAALKRASGDVHLILGGHTLLPRDYTRRCVEALVSTGADCVGGAMESAGSGYVGEAIACAMGSAFGVGASGFRVATGASGPLPTDTVPFGVYRRDVFDRIGYYNPAMVRHQDYELNWRLRNAGGRIVLLPALRVRYHVRPTLSRLWSQYWQYGIWKGRFLRAHPESLKLRHLAPPLLVLGLALGALAALASPAMRPLAVLIFGAYALFLAVAALTLGSRGAARHAPLLPLVLACLHVSYGAGVWLGLASPLPVASPRAAAA